MHQLSEDCKNLALYEARTSFQKDLMYREWASRHGGVYVYKKDDPESNQTEDNNSKEKQLVHIPPEKMIRQVYDITGESGRSLGHITSLLPVNPANRADAWEHQALLQLQDGNEETYEIQMIEDEKVFRYMGQLIVEESCLSCHGWQGYKLGDVRGGISITIPYAPFDKYYYSQLRNMLLGIIVIWITGILTLRYLFRRLKTVMDANSVLLSDLEDEKQYFKNLFHNLPEGIVLVDEKSNIFRVNDGFCELFGYTKEEVIGKNVDQLIADKKHQTEALNITRQFSKNRQHMTIDSIRYHKDSKPIEVSIVGAPIVTDKGQLQVLGIYRDISHQKKIEHKLKESSKKYKKLSDRFAEANSLKSLLLDIITHDLKNPAGVISGASDILKQEYPDAELVDMIHQGSDNILRVIENATALSKLSMDEAILFEEIDIIPLIQHAVNSFKQSANEANMVIEVDLPPTLNLKSHVIIEEVFKNYISNAIKYASGSKEIIISSKIQSDMITIEVSDFGETIKDEYRKKIFTRSFQLERAKGKGSGLGLSIVKKIASAHNAKVGVSPNSPTGNIFYISFPVTAP